MIILTSKEYRTVLKYTCMFAQLANTFDQNAVAKQVLDLQIKKSNLG